MKDTLSTLCELTNQLCNRDLSTENSSKQWIQSLEEEITRLRSELKAIKRELQTIKGQDAD